jgi:hypothetical protein
MMLKYFLVMPKLVALSQAEGDGKVVDNTKANDDPLASGVMAEHCSQ